MHLLSSTTLTGECENHSIKVFFNEGANLLKTSFIGVIFNKVTETTFFF